MNRSRCLHYGGAVHDSSEDCVQQQSSPTCINCNGDHLASSHDCPKLLTHKMALSLAATENISVHGSIKVCVFFWYRRAHRRKTNLSLWDKRI